MQYTVRNVPDELDQVLRERAAAERKSINRALLDALARGLGIEASATKKRDLSDVAGQGLITPEMEAVFEEQRQIDSEIWQ